MSDMDNKFSGQWSVVGGRGAEKGFSLIEVVIITAIIGILTTIAVLNFGGIIDSYKVRGAASHLYSDMQLARLRAIKEGKEYQVVFTAETKTYVVKIKNGATIKTVGLSSDYSGIKMCNTTTAEFNPNGSAGGGDVIISKGKRAQRVYISSTGTGNIKIVNSTTLCT